ncbi:DUF503 family protein [bacterium]|nr:DUF503 family protein [bacterium]
MHILLVQYHLHLPDCHSLKDKRQVMKPLLNELRRDFNISAAEIDDHDLWQSAVIATVAVSNLRDAVERSEREVTDRIETNGDVQIAQINREWL